MPATLKTGLLLTGPRMSGRPAADLLHDARAQERAARISDAIASYEAAIAAAERGFTAAEQRGSGDDQRGPLETCDVHSCALWDEGSNFAISAVAPSRSNVARAACAITVAAGRSPMRCRRLARSR